MNNEVSKSENFDSYPKSEISEILKFCLEKGILVDKETCGLLSEFDEETARSIVEKISNFKERLITKSFLDKNAEKISELIGDKKIIEKLRINLGLSLEILRERHLEEVRDEKEEGQELEVGNLRVLFSASNPIKKIEVADFVKYFRARYSEIKNLLQERKELEGLTSINKMNGSRQGVSIIGIVFDKRITKNKNILLEVEDLTGRATILINKSKIDVYDKSKDVLIDDVIGIRGFWNNEIIFANEIIYPDAFLQEKTRIDRDESAAFISDIHMGSKNFLEENFLKFINWINGELGDEKQKEDARKVKYLFITGDCVDGVGIFPGQESLLEIKDIKEQYNKLAEYLSRIRKDVKIIMCPGQHDSVRVAEPQPAIGEDYGKPLHALSNVILVSNPAMIEITNNSNKGIKILMYHGASMTHYVNEIESLRLGKAHNNPSKVVKELLKRRHLASIHSSVTYVPNENYDPLLIREIPDIINTADFHKSDVDIYNNILIICSSCWQSITPFEEKVGNVPDYCKVPVFNLKTREIKILDFYEKNN
jgi:DNA polymerase II small subunit